MCMRMSKCTLYSWVDTDVLFFFEFVTEGQQNQQQRKGVSKHNQ